MNKRNHFVVAASLLFLILLTGCSGGPFSSPTPTITPFVTNTPLPTIAPTATPIPYYVTALVFPGEIQAPAILYHRFSNDSHEATSTYTRYSDLKAELQKLYDAGFSLVSMSSWLDGTFTVPEGRKPLLFTIDDGLYADQLYINDAGVASDYSGLGILYQFSQAHPDFGFAASVYVNMGDKLYGDLFIGNWFYVSDGNAWKTKLANTLVWAIENNIEIFNHTYTHVDLSQTDPKGITYQLQKNDQTEREFLALVNRSDLDDRLGNIIALPYGIWPATQSGIDAVKNYINPEGKPVSAILEAYNANEPLLTPSIFSSTFDRMSIPRITSTVGSIDWVVAHKDEIPTMQSCQLGPTTETLAHNPASLQVLLNSALKNNTCPEGVYHINGSTFVAANGKVTQFGSTGTSTPGK